MTNNSEIEGSTMTPMVGPSRREQQRLETRRRLREAALEEFREGRLRVLDGNPSPRECLHTLAPGPIGGHRGGALQVGALLLQLGIVPADLLGRCHLSLRELLTPMHQGDSGVDRRDRILRYS